MIERFEIIDYNAPRPQAERILFCDGAGGALFDPNTDVELSHWRPNQTPIEYRAGTSTEICYRFLDNPRPGTWTAAVNNHVDVDGVLSIYVLLHSHHALAHRQTILEAAEMGDFWGWGELPAQRLFQGLTHLMQQDDDPQAVYTEAFRRVPGFIDGSDPQVSQIEAELTPLRTGVELIETGQIFRRQTDTLLAQYVIPRAVARDVARASYVPEFNELISANMLLWPQVRARWDAERVCHVAVEHTTGWFHDLWFPGYLWADTEGKRRDFGLVYHEGMSRYQIDNDRLLAAFKQLQQSESAAGHWALGGTTLPLSEQLQERFPLVGRFLNQQAEPAASQLSPHQVAKTLDGVFLETR